MICLRTKMQKYTWKQKVTYYKINSLLMVFYFFFFNFSCCFFNISSLLLLEDDGAFGAGSLTGSSPALLSLACAESVIFTSIFSSPLTIKTLSWYISERVKPLRVFP